MLARKFSLRQLIAPSKPSNVRPIGGAAILKRRLYLPLRAMHILRKWPFFFAFCAVAIFGCGGNGTNQAAGVTGAGATTATTGRASFGVNFPLNIAGSALIDTYLLPGAGRAPQPYEVADVGHIDYIDADGNNTATDNKLPSTLTVDLNNFNAQNRRVVASIPAPEGSSVGQSQSRLFQELHLDILDVRQSDGFQTQTYTPTEEPIVLDNVILSGFPGRTTAVQIFLNSGMFILDPTSGTFTFDKNQFNAVNANPTSGKLTGFLSDYLEFDISNVPNPPQMVSTPGPAKKLFVSRDFYALGGPTPSQGSTSPFEVLTDTGTFPGIYRPADPRLGVKTYELQQPNPVFGNVGTITALKGVYFDYTERITAAQNPLMIAFPKTGDGSKQEVIIYTRNGTTVMNMWFGTINYTSAGGPTFTVFPIGDLQPASAVGPIKGTLTNLLNKRGQKVDTTQANWWQFVRGATWNVTSGSGIPASSGTMVVYRV